MIDATIETMALGGNIMPHLHLPVQSGNNRILKEMNRKYTREHYLELVNYAKEKGKLVTAPHHHVLTAAHPSPLSAYNGFFGCRHFSKASKLLGETVNFAIKN